MTTNTETVDAHLDKLHKLADKIKNTPDAPNVVNGLMTEASYHSTSVSRLIAAEAKKNMEQLEGVMKDANTNIGKLEGVMDKVKGIVKDSDIKALYILLATIFTLAVAAITFVDAYQSSRKHEKLPELNQSMDTHLNKIEALLTRQQEQLNEQTILLQHMEALLAKEKEGTAKKQTKK